MKAQPKAIFTGPYSDKEPRLIVHVLGPREAAAELAAYLTVALARYSDAKVIQVGKLRWHGRYQRYSFELESAG